MSQGGLRFGLQYVDILERYVREIGQVADG